MDTEALSREEFNTSDKLNTVGAKLAGACGYGFVRRATSYGTILLTLVGINPRPTLKTLFKILSRW
ncbi:hypothetical protein C7Y70_01870 [Pseudoalteromonas sp. KS88]|nr:hypothetical protein C7Y70_01870 [Pseudoalteromonas sp. KS88]